MAFLYGSLLILICVMSKLVLGTLKTPVFAYSVIWCVVGFVANLGLYDYYLPSSLVNACILCGIIVFFMVYGQGLTGMEKAFFIDDLEINTTHINWAFFIVSNIVGIVLMIPSLKNAVGLLGKNGLWYIRANAAEVFSSGIIASLADSFIRPWFVATTVLAVVYSFSGGSRKSKIYLLLLAVAEDAILVFTTAGRAPIVNFLFYFIIAFLLFRGKNIHGLFKKEKKKIILLIIFAIGIVALTQMRSTSDVDSKSILRTFYTYYFSGPSYLTKLLENVTSYGIGGKKFWGAATFGFISNIYSIIMIALTGQSQGTLYIMGSVITNEQYWVGKDTLLNAMCTGYYPFLLDWGYVGIIIGPVILGIFTTIITKRVYRNKSLFNISIYIYWIYALLRTVFKWDLVNIDLSVVLVALYLTTYNRENKVRNN